MIDGHKRVKNISRDNVSGLVEDNDFGNFNQDNDFGNFNQDDDFEYSNQDEPSEAPPINQEEQVRQAPMQQPNEVQPGNTICIDDVNWIAKTSIFAYQYFNTGVDRSLCGKRFIEFAASTFAIQVDVLSKLYIDRKVLKAEQLNEEHVLDREPSYEKLEENALHFQQFEYHLMRKHSI